MTKHQQGSWLRRRLRAQFPEDGDLKLIVAFTLACLAVVTYEVVLLAIRWHDSETTPSLALSSVQLEEMRPAFRVCLEGVDIDLDALKHGRRAQAFELAAALVYEDETQGGCVQELTIPFWAFAAGLYTGPSSCCRYPCAEVPHVTHDYSLYTSLSTGSGRPASCVAINPTGVLAIRRVQPNHDVSIMVAVLAYNNSEGRDVPGLILGTYDGDQYRDQTPGQYADMWDTQAGSVEDATVVNPVRQKSTFVGVNQFYDVMLNVDQRVALNGHTTTEYTQRPTFVSSSKASELASTPLGFLLGNRSLPGLVSVSPTFFRVHPANFITTQYRTVHAYGFSSFLADLGGILSVILALYSVFFPIAVVLPRAARGRGWCGAQQRLYRGLSSDPTSPTNTNTGTELSRARLLDSHS